MRALRDADERSAATGDGAVLYVHGYATSFRRGISQASEIMHRGRTEGPLVVFSWPAHRALATMPTRRALISGAYREDSVMAAASQLALREAVAVVLSATRPGTLTLLGKTNPKLRRFESTPLALKELEAGGLDAVVADNGVIAHYVAHNGGQRFRAVSDRPSPAMTHKAMLSMHNYSM